MHDWSKEIEDTIAPLNLSAAREAEVVEELSQHLNERYDELLIAGTGEEQPCRILVEELTDGTLVAGLKGTTKAAIQPVPMGVEGATSYLRAFGTTCITALACFQGALALQLSQFFRWPWGLPKRSLETPSFAYS
jgi:hypothetical protein